MSVTELLFSFQGRANRAQYWLAPCLLSYGSPPQSWVASFFASDADSDRPMPAPVAAAAQPMRRQQPAATVSARQPTFGKMGRPRGLVS
jgi:hypothetical protein